MIKILVPFFLFISILSYSQDKIPFIDIDEISTSVANEAENGEYEKALELLDQINKNDSAYTSVLVTKSFYQLALKQYDKALETINIGLATDCGDLKASFYQNKAVSLLNQEKYIEAIKVLDEGLQFFPKNHLLTYNRAVALEKLERLEEAVKAYEATIVLNPFYKKAYLQLGNICYKQERISQALMCFNMYLLIEPDADNSFKIINSINNIVSAKNENEQNANFQISKDDEAFDDIDLILSNKIALNKNYKIDNEIKVALAKQNHVLLDQLKDFEGNGGFWDTKFVPFYKWVASEGHFDQFIYTILYSIENEKFKKIIEKNTKKIISFIELFQPKWAEIVQLNKTQWQGQEENVTFYYDDYLKAVGQMENEITFGYWEFYNEKGRLTGAGNFDAKGNREGEWKWFNTLGGIKEIANYKNGKLNGENNYFHENAEKYIVSSYKDDQLEGEYLRHNKRSALLERKLFKNGKLDGLYQSYFNLGSEIIEYSIPYKNDLVDEKATEYYANGDVYSEISFDNGVRNGLEKKFHPNKKVSSEINYFNGDLQGTYKTFFSNGNPLEVGQSLEGYYNGPWKTYYRDGTLQSDFSYDKGSLNSTYVFNDRDGKLYYEYEYRKGDIIAYKFYDKQGAIVKEAKKKGGEFYYESYAPNGNKTSEGLYDISGGKKGEWKFYSSNGVLSDNGNYSDNKAQGEYTTFYKNGDKESISKYKNDSLVGYYVDYHKNGKLNTQGWYKNSLRHGEWHTYYTDGTINSINYYHSGKLNGDQKYHNGNGELASISKYKYDKLYSDEYLDDNGMVFETMVYGDKKGTYTLKLKYKNGQVERSVDYVNGVKHGDYNYFDFYGNKVISGRYLNGNIDGELIWYHKDGSIESTMNYVNATKHGPYVSNYENGQIESKGLYEFGNKTGIWTNYYEDGVVDSVSEYKDDVYHGRREFYSPSGNLQLVRFYEYGRLVGYSYLGKDSKEIPMIPIKNETAKIIAYYDNGKVSREMECKNGDFINTYKTYFYDGQLENEMGYDQDESNGLDIEYFSDGTIKKQQDFLLGNLHGVEKEFHSNGQLKKETTYVNNSKEGAAMTYDVNGKLIRTEIYFGDDIISSQTN